MLDKRSPVPILYLDHTARFSGAQGCLLGLLERLDRARFSPVLACPRDGPLVERAQALGVPVEELSLPTVTFRDGPVRVAQWLLRSILLSQRLAALVKRRGIGLIHANSVRAGLAAALAARRTRTPLVWHVRDLLPGGLRSRVVRRLAALGADRVICISHAVAGRFATSEALRRKTVVVYDGVDLRRFAPDQAACRQAREALGPGDAYPVVAIVGQIIQWKGQREFVLAAARVAKAYPGARFLVVGEAVFRTHLTRPYKEEVVRLAAELGLGDRIRFTGFCDDVRPFIAAADILALASWEEPLGVVQLEAMALGKPVVATNGGGVPEILEDGVTGLLVPPRYPEAMAHAIVALAADPDRLRRMGQAGRRRVESLFGLDSHARAVEEVYGEVLEPDRSTLGG